MKTLILSLIVAADVVQSQYETPLLRFANSAAAPPAVPAWQDPGFPFERKELEKENNRSANAQVEWTLRGTTLKVVCPTTQDVDPRQGVYGASDERPDEADSADNKIGACRYGFLASNDPQILAWYKAQDWKMPYPVIANELAKYWKIKDEFAKATTEEDAGGQTQYTFHFEGPATGRLGDTQTVPWIGHLRIKEVHGWVSASFIEQRADEANKPAEQFWNSPLLSGVNVPESRQW